MQYHPEFKCKPTRAHPLFDAFIAAALQYKAGGTAPHSRAAAG